MSSGASSFEVIYAFPVDGGGVGGQPHGSLTTVGTGDSAFLTGRTFQGGDGGDGTVFRINPDGSNPTRLHEFGGAPSDGGNPRHDSMLLLDSVLYGMTVAGGSANLGTVFQVATDGSTYRMLHEFTGGANDGSTPHSGLIFDGTDLWGLTEKGGTHDTGTLFRMARDGSSFEVVESFHSLHGEEPHGTPHQFGDQLVGMTRKGGSNGYGVVFSYAAGAWAPLHSFVGSKNDGATPYHGNLTAVDSLLYGLTHDGGTDGVGVLFSINLDGNLTVLHSSEDAPNDGSHPLGSLLPVPDERKGSTWLYGTTDDGGADKLGTVFRIRTDRTGYEVLHSFSSSDGTNPPDNLVLCGNYLYGMTQFGPGASQSGTIFRIGA
jgi:uncharacterized repeat protein (TIGR03803 family)